ncbi:MAG: ScyD/ScyE family protein [Pyrinomonadaceae bacterium]
MKHKILSLVIALGCALLVTVESFAQATSVFTTGLNNPSKIITAGQTSLLVAEPGTTAPNSGRISLVNRASGARQTLIDNLPSAINLDGGAPEAIGPSGLKLSGQKLYLTIGSGNTAMPTTGGLILNPAPASPLFDSILELTLPADYETLASGFALSFANQTTLNGNAPVTLTNAEGKQLTVRLVANLPNHIAEPRPALPEHIRTSNLYGIELSGDSLYVVDASFNLLYRVNIATGAFETFATFASKPNPTPVGPPFIEAVPDSIRLVGNNLLISFLTGFPFVQGLAEVRTVNLDTRAQAVFIGGLTSALDVLQFNGASNTDSYLVLEFSANMLAQQPGRLKLFTLPSQTPRILADNLITPTSVARDLQTGNIFVTEKATGRILRITFPRPAFDFDGDGKADVSVFRPSNMFWYINPSSNPTSFYGFPFGLATDKLAPADYDGDGKADVAVYRPSNGTLYLLRSSSGFLGVSVSGASASDIPAPADFDGDGRADFALFRPGSGTYLVYNLASNQTSSVSQFGFLDGKPVPADYDGDGKADYAVFRPSDGNWLISTSQGNRLVQFGFPTDKTVVGDYDGDGKADIAVFRPETGYWYYLRSSDGGFRAFQFGFSTDIPVPADYDGDGITDIAVFRPSNGVWYILRSSNNQLQFANFGAATDIPIPSVYVR